MDHASHFSDDDGWEDLPAELPVDNEESSTNHPTIILPTTTTTPTSTKKIINKIPKKTTHKKTIISHPMEHIGLKFGLEFIHQLYYQNDWSFRLAVLLWTIACFFRCILYSCYLYLYPRQLMLGGIGLIGIAIPMIAGNWTNIRMALDRVTKILSSRDDDTKNNTIMALAEFMEDSLTSKQLRMIMALLAYIVPVVLTIRTYQFLAELTVVSVFAISTFFASLLLVYYYYNPQQTSTTTLQFLTYILYGCALLALPQQELRHLPSIASHFCMASGLLLYQRSEGNLSETLQRTLRCTIRKILVDAKTTVEQDELLQLTMLRWLADYWAQTAPSSESTTGHSETPAANESTQQQQVPLQEQHEVEWSELSSMLQQTTTQITHEAMELQQQEESAQQPESRQNVPQPPAESKSTTAVSQRPNPPNEFANSMESLQAMLTQMNIDDDAKPAVQSYKRMVSSIPPKRSSAVFLGLLHRLPVTILVAVYCILAVAGLYYPPNMTVYPLLFPVVLIELLQVQQWVEACRLAGGVMAPDLPEDAMIFLLVDRSPDCSLLNVWRNINASVSALETGLVAARCVQTTALAADFCANMLSLANLGIEVSQHGWMHGLGIIARELIHLHQTATPLEHLTHGMASPHGTSYTSAAVSAIRNSQRMGQNIHVLAHEHGALPALAPIAGALPVLIGQGWLWDSRRRQQELRKGDESASFSDRIVELVDDVPQTSPSAETSNDVLLSTSRQSTIRGHEQNNWIDEPTEGPEPAYNKEPPESAYEEKVGITAVEETVNISDLDQFKERGQYARNSLSEGRNEDSDDSFEPISDGEVQECKFGETARMCVDEPTTTSCRNRKQEANDPPDGGSGVGTGDTLSSVKDDEDTAMALERPDDDNIWIKVGAGGLAIVGAVAALAATHHRISEASKRGGRKSDNNA